MKNLDIQNVLAKIAIPTYKHTQRPKSYGFNFLEIIWTIV